MGALREAAVAVLEQLGRTPGGDSAELMEGL